MLFIVCSTLAVVLIYWGDHKHGQIWTESATIGGLVKFLTRSAAIGNGIVFFLILTLLTGVTAGALGLSWMLFVESLVIGFGWILVVVPAINVATAYWAHFLFRSYSRAKFGQDRPKYGEWSEFDQRARQEGRGVNIFVSGNGWSPVHTGPKESLAHRSSTRATSTSHRSSSSTGASHRSANAPIMLPSFRLSPSRGTAHRSSSSSKSGSSGGSGGAAAGGGCIIALLKFWAMIAAIMVQILIIVGLGLLCVLYAYGAYKMTMAVINNADEEYVVDFYA